MMRTALGWALAYLIISALAAAMLIGIGLLRARHRDRDAEEWCE